MSTPQSAPIETQEGKKKEPARELLPVTKPVIICGWCGAIEIYLSNGKTECPNCDEYLH